MNTTLPENVTFRMRLQVEQQLEKLVTQSGSSAHTYGPEFLHLWNTAARLVRGGKLVRPMMLLEVHDALLRNSTLFSGSLRSVDGWQQAQRGEALRIAAAIEMLHFAFLLHDDVIDGDLLRRGRPNLIGELIADAGHKSDPSSVRHWAQTGAILAGNLMLTSAHQVFARADLPTATRSRLLDLLQHTVLETTAGEFTDVGLSDGIVDPDLATVLAMTTRKTACYSFEFPLRAAVILAKGPPELEHTLSGAGAHLGLAYQLRDDLLSTFGDPALHGKDAYSDLREGKRTAIICFAKMTSAWPKIEPDFGNPDLTPERAGEIRELLRHCGAEDFVLQLIAEQRAAFFEIVEHGRLGITMPKTVASVLRDLATRLEGRTS